MFLHALSVDRIDFPFEYRRPHRFVIRMLLQAIPLLFFRGKLFPIG